MSKIRARLSLHVAAIVFTALTALFGSVPLVSAASPVTIQETGSTLIYPLFNLWAQAYHRAHPSVLVNTEATGSGTGISDAVNGTVQIGASDAYMSDALMAAHPGMLNVALAISSQLVMYHVPGLGTRHLNLSGSVLAGIYEGRIRYWDDRAIARLNPGLRLPHLAIVPVRRSDGSGDTFLFTQYLAKTSPGWAKAVGFGTSVSWPSIAAELGAQGNAGMVQALAQTQGAIGYVGISYLDQATKAGLGYAALQNLRGRFVLPTAASIEAAAQAETAATPKDERISLVLAPGNGSYPIINYEYAIVKADQGSAAAAVRAFLDWAVSPTGGNAPAFLAKVHFLPLPPAIRGKSETQIRSIH
jgi:phosphate transport system substrate-binding protein